VKLSGCLPHHTEHLLLADCNKLSEFGYAWDDEAEGTMEDMN